MPSGPVAARELVVVEGKRRGPRVFESSIQPVLPEEPEEMHTAHSARGAPLREKIGGEPVANATVGPALPARIVPIELPVESQITARQEVVGDVAKAEIGIKPRELIGSFLPGRPDIAESRTKDRAWILAQRQGRAQSLAPNRAAYPQVP